MWCLLRLWRRLRPSSSPPRTAQDGIDIVLLPLRLASSLCRRARKRSLLSVSTPVQRPFSMRNWVTRRPGSSVPPPASISLISASGSMPEPPRGSVHECCWRPYGSEYASHPVPAFSTGCRQDMHDQPKPIPLRASTFFSDERSARPLVEGTVAREHLRDDTLLETGRTGNGKSANEDATVFPFRVDARVIARGRERYDIYCSPCHGRTGNGDGMVVRRGFRRPPSYHDDRLREAPVGHFVDVITNGFGAMADYRQQVEPRDRWAITAYIRALQLSEHATMADVPAAERARLQ